MGLDQTHHAAEHPTHTQPTTREAVFPQINCVLTKILSRDLRILILLGKKSKKVLTLYMYGLER